MSRRKGRGRAERGGARETGAELIVPYFRVETGGRRIRKRLEGVTERRAVRG